MNLRMLVAIVLVCVGVIALGYQGISYTTRERVVDVGPVHVDEEKTHTIPITPFAGGAALAGGIVLLLIGRRAAE